jgi:SSS family solute:Na+ symporter
MRKNPLTKHGAAAGIVVGVAAVAVVTLTHSTFVSLMPFLPAKAGEVNVGFAALMLNALIAAAVSLAARAAETAAPAPPRRASAADDDRA